MSLRKKSVTGNTVIVNADDFGISEAVNRAIIEAFERGVISSSTIMANMPGFEEACEQAFRRGIVDRIGIHINISEGVPLTSRIRTLTKFCSSDEKFCFRRNTHWRLSDEERSALADEVRQQISRCREHGLPLTHADSHLHVHTEAQVFSVMRPVLRDLGIKAIRITENVERKSLHVAAYKAAYNAYLRRCGFHTTDHFCGAAALDISSLWGDTEKGSWEIMTHPGYDADGRIVDLTDGAPLFLRMQALTGRVHMASYQQYGSD